MCEYCGCQEVTAIGDLTREHDEVVALIRNPDHAEDVRNAGATPAVVDLEHATADAVAAAIAGADAVVFAAGAGPGSGAAQGDDGLRRCGDVDRGGEAGRDPSVRDRQRHGSGFEDTWR